MRGGARAVPGVLLLVVGSFLPGTAAAAEAAAGQPERLPVMSRRSHIQPISEMRTAQPPDRVAAVGLQLSRAPEILRRQLALSRGEGLVVNAVAPQSAAAQVGIQPHDVLVRLDDQLLVLPEQLAVLLEATPLPPVKAAASNQATGSVMTILRAGRPLRIPLGEPAAATRRPQPAPNAVPASPPAPAVQVAPVGEAIAAGETDEAVLLREDDDFTIRVSQAADTRLTVLTPAGHRVFDGRIDTPERLAEVPPVLRPRVDAMLRVLGPQPPAVRPGEPLGIAPVQISP